VITNRIDTAQKAANTLKVMASPMIVDVALLCSCWFSINHVPRRLQRRGSFWLRENKQTRLEYFSKDGRHGASD
jgi:hypothetical protein